MKIKILNSRGEPIGTYNEETGEVDLNEEFTDLDKGDIKSIEYDKEIFDLLGEEDDWVDDDISRVYEDNEDEWVSDDDFTDEDLNNLLGELLAPTSGHAEEIERLQQTINTQAVTIINLSNALSALILGGEDGEEG